MARKIITPEIEEDIAYLYMEGVLLRVISEELDVSSSTISRVRKQMNLPNRGYKNNGNPNRRRWSDGEVMEMIEMRENGATYQDVAMELGRTYTACWQKNQGPV